MGSKNKEVKKRPKIKIKKGDIVMVCRGKDRGKTGKVLKVDYDNLRVYVEGINIVKKHVKPRNIRERGGIIEKEAPIHISNVMLVDPKTNKPTRIKIVRKEDGSFERVSKKSGEVIK